MGFIRQAEAKALRIRLQAGVGAGSVIEPEVFVSHLGMEIFDLSKCSPGLIAELRSRITPKDWSGAYLPIPNRPGVILLHPDMTPERRRVTVMEEIVHILLKHKPTTIVTVDGRPFIPDYDSDTESEARTVAAACLLPLADLRNKILRGWTGQEIATFYRVSIELVEFRAKTCGLWKAYRRADAVD